jgi:hypothetical protein
MRVIGACRRQSGSPVQPFHGGIPRDFQAPRHPTEVTGNDCCTGLTPKLIPSMSAATATAASTSGAPTPRGAYVRARRQIDAKLQALLATLDESALEAIRAAFDALGFVVALHDFVRILRAHLPWQKAPAPSAVSADADTTAVAAVGGGIMAETMSTIMEESTAAASSTALVAASSASPPIASSRSTAPSPSPSTQSNTLPDALTAPAVPPAPPAAELGLDEDEFTQAAVALFQTVDVNGGSAIKFDDFLSSISAFSLFFPLFSSYLEHRFCPLGLRPSYSFSMPPPS